MTLLSEIITLEEGKRGVKLPPKGKKIGKVADTRNPSERDRNFVAKNSQQKAGAGTHEDKRGERAKRSRQKANWKKDANRDME